MLPFGGELSLERSQLSYFFTDSGRSSLRLFCRNFSDKKFLIPDFLCKVIVDVLIENNIDFDFYHIGGNLDISITNIQSKTFDVLYVINYFGSRNEKLFKLKLDEKILLEDNVFFMDFNNTYKAKNWFSFNSFRKVTALSEGSLIKTNLIIQDYRSHRQAPYVIKKTQAKHLKFIYQEYSQGSESDYLRLFDGAEEELEQQNVIYAMSDYSQGLLLSFMRIYEEEKRIRQENYTILNDELSEYALNIEHAEYSFFVFKSRRRDELRKYLFSKKIYLPIHWPIFNLDNPLYTELLSVPLFSNYSSENLKLISSYVKLFYEK
ncbi:hypothetical protein [Polynucleobacter sphagniphilus]|uniref:hypothetical protein n=1 Tax=Polynucleobacter sphagniphilus TaxID=1743169 RepID=UPI00247362D3|nr:hypothetical protein [Polynucleobacter sphagniphilus]MDH6525573.1 hypothetical protein [Polynucleobacter sphagniphilus]